MTDDTQARASVPPLLLPGHSMWAIRPDVLPRLIEAHRTPVNTDLVATVDAITPSAARRLTTSSETRVAGAVAVVPLCGVITPRGSFLSMLFGGGGGLMSFREEFAEALTSPDVGAIVLDIDSPGGLVSLVPETAAQIRAARGVKPIIAVCNTLAASAAYWIATQADEVVCTPSGECGSVGVYMVHEDWSGFNEQMGVVPQYISAGEYKTEGNPDEPLSDAGQKAWQQEVDDLYAMFVQGVADGRGITADAVAKNYGQGRCLLAERALEAGMCDRIDTLETVVAELLGQEPDEAEDKANGEASRLTVIVPSSIVKVEGADQPRCACGKYLAPGESECEACRGTASAEDDEKPPAKVDEPDDEDEDEDEDDENDGEPIAAEHEARVASILFG